MIKENRYIVFKMSDTEKYLTEAEREIISILQSKIDSFRSENNKDLLSCVVVESDWPMFESTWEAIENWVSDTDRKALRPHQPPRPPKDIVG